MRVNTSFTWKELKLQHVHPSCFGFELDSIWPINICITAVQIDALSFVSLLKRFFLLFRSQASESAMQMHSTNGLGARVALKRRLHWPASNILVPHLAWSTLLTKIVRLPLTINCNGAKAYASILWLKIRLGWRDEAGNRSKGRVGSERGETKGWERWGEQEREGTKRGREEIERRGRRETLLKINLLTGF